MTTLRQKLVRKKNRKLRRLRELYPSINVKLFYARDFRALMLKYGKHALVDGLSGSSGQVALPHAVHRRGRRAEHRSRCPAGDARSRRACSGPAVGASVTPLRRARPRPPDRRRRAETTGR